MNQMPRILPAGARLVRPMIPRIIHPVVLPIVPPNLASFVFLFLLFLFSGIAGNAWATPPAIDWVARYGGLGNGNNQVTDMVVDSNGDTYVTGYSSGLSWDIATVKYSPSGRLLWVRRYNGAPGGDDVPSAMTLDSNGNVIVVGYSCATSQFNHDFLTIKYDSTLVQQWARTFAGQNNGGLDEAYAVTTDSFGSVYATGSAFEPSTDDDIVTIKYDASGAQQWFALFNGIGNAGDSGNAIEVDADERVYVTGLTQRASGGGNMDATTLKYAANGSLEWVQTFNGTANTNDSGLRIAVDSQRNVYVAGFTSGSGTLFDMLTIKYSRSGHMRWLRTYDGNHAHDAALDMVMDRNANVYITGYATLSGTQSDYATIKYDSTGVRQWVRTYDGPVTGFDEGQSVAVDDDFNVYVTGYSDGGTGQVNYDYATLKYDPAGNQQWAVRYNGTGNNIDVAVKVAPIGLDRVVVSGWSTGLHSPDVDFATILYDQSGASSVPDSDPGSGPGGSGTGGGPLFVDAAGPNPFHDAATVRYRLLRPSLVDLTLWDTAGRKVRTILHDWEEAGDREAVIPGSEIREGIYLYRLSAGGETITGKIARR